MSFAYWLECVVRTIKLRWQKNGELNQHIAAGERLGENCKKNFITRDLPIEQGCQLSLSLLGSASFSLDIHQGSTD